MSQIAHRIDTGANPPVHSKPQWFCDLCGFECYWLEVMLQHLRTRHEQNPLKVDLDAGEICQETANS